MNEVTDTPAGKTVKAKRPAPKAGKVRSVRIEVADNGGFSVSIDYKPVKRSGDGPSAYIEPKSHVYATFDDLEAALRKALA